MPTIAQRFREQVQRRMFTVRASEKSWGRAIGLTVITAVAYFLVARTGLRLRYVKDPDTGKRRSKVNKAETVIEKDVPHLRIIEQGLWDAVKQRQAEVMLGPQRIKTKPWDRRRPRYLLSGLVKCGACDCGYVQISKTHLGCAKIYRPTECESPLAQATK